MRVLVPLFIVIVIVLGVLLYRRGERKATERRETVEALQRLTLAQERVIGDVYIMATDHANLYRSTEERPSQFDDVLFAEAILERLKTLQETETISAK